MRKSFISTVSACVVVALTAAAFIAPSSALAQDQKPPAPGIRILPINRATLLPGQVFDLRVEVSNVSEGTPGDDVTVTIGDQPLADFFSKEISATNATTSSVELTVRQVAFTEPGTYTVTAVYSDVTQSVAYVVVNLEAPETPAKNVILFVGDGMAWPMLTIARLVSKGQTQGRFNGRLNMDHMDEIGFVTTSGYDSIATDSANSMAAYTTGQKGVINAMGVYEDNTSDPNDDPRVENIAEILRRTRNMAIGIVTTSEVQDATPAAVVAHTRRRAEKQYITDVFAEFQPEVLMGGGSAYFVPKTAEGSKRTDERNVIEDLEDVGYTVVANRAEMNNASDTAKLLGLFHPENMNVYIDRQQLKDPEVLGPYPDQPTLIEMTEKAIKVLSNSERGKENGFFLMVEGASIDKQLHPMDWERAAGDTIELDQALGAALDYARTSTDTLVVVTADHAHSVSVYGAYDATKGPGIRAAVGVYNQAKFPTYADEDGDGFPDKWDADRVLAVGFGNHPDVRDDFIFNPQPIEPTVRDPNLTRDTRFVPNPEKDPAGVVQAGNLPYGVDNEVHSVDDVPLFAQGPGSRNFHGIHDNTEIFLDMMAALGLVDATGNGQ